VTPAQDKRRPAHRPSRRKEIIAAATKTFSRDGYVEARIEDIARAAGVAPTAIYYHFGGKEELFTQALRAAMAGFSERIFLARPDFEAPNTEGLRKVLAAGWEFWSTHPDEARLVARYSEGPTQHALELRQEWEERHLQRAYDYMPAARSARSTRKAREQHAAHTMAIRVMLDVILTTQATVLEGPSSRVARGPLVAAVEEMCISLIMSLRDSLCCSLRLLRRPPRRRGPRPAGRRARAMASRRRSPGRAARTVRSRRGHRRARRRYRA
jgi:AcrR family transcriptional regulator